MSWEGYTWILLRAIGVSSQDIISVLQPVQGQFPSTEADFDTICLTLRRMGHIRETAPNDLAHALRSNDRGSTIFVEPDGMAFPVSQATQDPWMTADPWGGNAKLLSQSAPQQQQSAMQGAWSNQHQQQPTSTQQAFPAQNQWQGESDADTDSNTESSHGE